MNQRTCRLCPATIDNENKSGLCRKCYALERQAAKPSERLAADLEQKRLSTELKALKGRYDVAQRTIKELEADLQIVDDIADSVETHKIEPKKGEGSSEGTVVLVASDWHIEERVRPGTVNGLNEYNLDISKARGEKFFQNGLRLTRLLQQDIAIDHLVLPLLGDFISNDIHEEFAENNELQPIHAIIEAQNRIASGIEFLLNHSKLHLVVTCHSGNHARTTITVRSSSENGHSLEYFMYRALAGYFRTEPRVTFLLPEGYHSYMDVYGQTVRFHHGHEIRYQGGVGGIFIPAFKAIDKWNQSNPTPADLDVFGHFHQMKDGNTFLSNGSLIGYNAYALRNKLGYEPPRQTLFLLDKKRGRTCTWPILVKE